MKAITKAELELFNKLNTSQEIMSMPLNLNFPYREILKEIEPLLDNFVIHRTNDDYSYDVHFGWKGLVLRGQHWFRTGDALMGDPDHHWTEVADMLLKISGKNLEKVYQPTEPTGCWKRSSDNTLIKTLTGWEPDTPLLEGLTRTFIWVKNNI